MTQRFLIAHNFFYRSSLARDSCAVLNPKFVRIYRPAKECYVFSNLTSLHCNEITAFKSELKPKDLTTRLEVHQGGVKKVGFPLSD